MKATRTYYQVCFRKDAMDRKEIARDELTSNPIFLFQSRWWNLTGLPYGYVVDDEGYIYEAEDRESIPEEAESVPITKFEHCQNYDGYSCLIEEWKTERVFFTREEGEAYAHSQAHNCPYGSRVYCVCAHGKLAEILKKEDRKCGS